MKTSASGRISRRATADVSVHVFLTENECTLYLDTSGQPLWQRGFRKASVDAPLKENLAAAS